MKPTDQIVALSQILDHHIPDMANGFNILTSYGDLRIEPGRLADNIRDLLAQHARLALMRLEVPAEAASAGEERTA